MDKGLRALGFSAPRIYGEDLDAGLLIVEDLGNEPVVDARGPIPERYAEATRLLAKLHTTTLPQVLPVAEGRDHAIPPYDLEALLIEVELLTDWYVPHIIGTHLSGLGARGVRQSLDRNAERNSRRTAHLDAARLPFAEPDLACANAKGSQRVGIIDFQDAVLGHPAYDVASLLQDARETVPPDLELKLIGLYARERRPPIAHSTWRPSPRAYAIMGAQRATKILGIFARLDRGDGKPQYLKHLPRIETYLLRNLAHPALSRLKGWYETHLPRLIRSHVSAGKGPEPDENPKAGRFLTDPERACPGLPSCSPPASASACCRSPPRCRSPS